MTPRSESGAAPLRRFLLESTPDDGEARLCDADLRHALSVVRLGIGDLLLGLDGRGAAWPLRVRAVERRRLELEVSGDVLREPQPGTEQAALPHVELAVCLPKSSRAESMFERLTQLGVGGLTPLVSARCESHARSLEPKRRARLERVANEACKQCIRLWSPPLAACQSLQDLLQAEPPGARALLDLGGGTGCAEWARSAQREGARHLTLIIGPEGGFTPEELALADTHGVRRVRLVGHVLRIETAAEAALAVCMQAWGE